MKIAVISDVHGNIWALEAVLKDIEQRKIVDIFDLGDSLYGPLEPKKTFELFRSNNIKSIKGNEDNLILDSVSKENNNPTINYVINQLDQEAFEWLQKIPNERLLNDSIIMFHGTHSNNSEYLVEKLYSDHIGIKTQEELNTLLSEVNQQIVLCGHSHTPRLVELGDKTIINPGSVGLQAYDDNLPMFHKIENHSSKARYCILDLEDKIRINHLAISYDFEKAARKAEQNNRRDWAQWIRTGRV